MVIQLIMVVMIEQDFTEVISFNFDYNLNQNKKTHFNSI